MSELESYHSLITLLVYACLVVVPIAWLITIVWIITRDDLPANEGILWLLIVTLVPVFGILLYWTNRSPRELRAFLKYWLPLLCWMGVIFAASSDTHSYEHSSLLVEPLLRWLFPHMPEAQIHTIHHLLRKCAHLTEYVVLAMLLWRGVHKPSKDNPRAWNWREVRLVMLTVMLYAATDEFHQRFVLTRTSVVSDVFIDTAGGTAALLALWLIDCWRRHRRNLP